MFRGCSKFDHKLYRFFLLNYDPYVSAQVESIQLFAKSVPNIQNYVNRIMLHPKADAIFSIPVPLSEMFTYITIHFPFSIL